MAKNSPATPIDDTAYPIEELIEDVRWVLPIVSELVEMLGDWVITASGQALPAIP
jgi:hypothetical protein